MKIIVILIALILLFAAAQSSAQSVDFAGSTLFHHMHDIKTSGDYGYGIFFNGLEVFNMTDPVSPQFVSKIYLSLEILTSAISDTCAYLLSGDHTMLIVNIADAEHPALVGSYSGQEYLSHIFVDGNYAYLSAFGGYLDIVDITDPANPVRSVYCDLLTSNSACASGGYVYTASQNLFTASRLDFPNQPILLNTCNLPVYCRDLCLNGSYVYVVGGEFHVGPHFFAIDISDPQNLSRVGTLDINGTPTNITVDGNYAYISDNIFALKVVDITNPADPQLLGTFGRFPSESKGLCKRGNYVYLADEYYGMQIFDASEPSSPWIVADYSDASEIYKLAVSGQYAYITEQNYFEEEHLGVEIVDIADLTNPIPAGHIFEPSGAMSIDIQGNYLYVGAWSVLDIFILSDPAAPERVGSISLHGSAEELVVRDNYAFIADGAYVGFRGLEVIDISDPANPIFGDTLSSASSADDIVLSGDRAYLSYIDPGPGGMNIIDISNPLDPFIIGGFSLYVPGIAVDGNYAFIAGPPFLVYDVSEPTNPTMIASCQSHGGKITIDENYAFVTGNGVDMINISNPASPEWLMQCGIFRGRDIEKVGNALYVIGDYAFMSYRVIGDTIGCSYFPGDANGNGQFNGIDVVYCVNYFKGYGNPPPDVCDCPPHGMVYAGADANGSCVFNGIDVTFSVNYLKGIGNPPEVCLDCPTLR
jgi:hypothetical protein